MFEAENGQLAKRAGRPTKFSDAMVDQLCAALADGCPIKCACTVAGIGVTTLNEWREKYPEVNQRMDEAWEMARQKALQAIKAAGEKEWRVHAEWLRLSFPGDYRGGKIDVNATAIAASQIVMTTEDLQQLQERVKRAEAQIANTSTDEP